MAHKIFSKIKRLIHGGVYEQRNAYSSEVGGMNNLDQSHIPWFDNLIGHSTISGCDDTLSAIVLCDGPSRGEGYERALELVPSAHVVAVNNGARNEGVMPQAFATMHCDTWAMSRPNLLDVAYYDSDVVMVGWSCNGAQHERIDYVLDGDPLCGTSSLIGTLAALWLGYGRVVVVGADMTPASGYGSESKLGAWKKWAPYFGGRVEALGGSLEAILREA